MGDNDLPTTSQELLDCSRMQDPIQNLADDAQRPLYWRAVRQATPDSTDGDRGLTGYLVPRTVVNAAAASESAYNDPPEPLADLIRGGTKSLPTNTRPGNGGKNIPRPGGQVERTKRK